MNRARRPAVVAALVVILTCSLLSIGCEPANWFGSNFGLTVVVPVGLGGSPGVLNPFGIVQALVNALLGAGASTGGVAADQNPAAPSVPAQFDPAIAPVLG
jgi:hypothetical protein